MCGNKGYITIFPLSKFFQITKMLFGHRPGINLLHKRSIVPLVAARTETECSPGLNGDWFLFVRITRILVRLPRRCRDCNYPCQQSENVAQLVIFSCVVTLTVAQKQVLSSKDSKEQLGDLPFCCPQWGAGTTSPSMPLCKLIGRGHLCECQLRVLMFSSPFLVTKSSWNSCVTSQLCKHFYFPRAGFRCCGLETVGKMCILASDIDLVLVTLLALVFSGVNRINAEMK